MTPPVDGPPRWQYRLAKEQIFIKEFEGLDVAEWRRVMRGRRVTSSNYDTVAALDWPHYCIKATEGCGGVKGFCYTFQGNQASAAHTRHAARTDVLARRAPDLFAELVVAEVEQLVGEGELPYPNLRYSGSGELTRAHLPALALVQASGVRLWGFSRNLLVAKELQRMGVPVIFSCDTTTRPEDLKSAHALSLPIAYTSMSASDQPPPGTVVTFPVHRGGRVREVVDTPSLCPKVVADFVEDAREPATCQTTCHRCHLKATS